MRERERQVRTAARSIEDNAVGIYAKLLGMLDDVLVAGVKALFGE